MALELIGVVRIHHSRYGQAAVYRVRCTVCGDEYARAGSPSNIRKTASCTACDAKRRSIYASPKERKRAQNQRYWARRKLRQAGA